MNDSFKKYSHASHTSKFQSNVTGRVGTNCESEKDLKIPPFRSFASLLPSCRGEVLYKEWILKTISDTWNLFYEKFTALWDKHKDGPGDAYLPEIYNNPELRVLVKQKYMEDLFHDTLGFGAAKMIRRIVGVAHVEDFESIKEASNRADCERKALNFAKTLLKERKKFHNISEVVSAIENVDK